MSIDERPLQRGAWRQAVSALPDMPRAAEEPAFHEPWEAEAFALTLALHERGVFAWSEWTAALAEEIGRAAAGGDERGYYHHWLAALERLVVDKGVTDTCSLAQCRDAWQRAAARTPHGSPIVLRRD